jgi:hypothetical protein
MVEKKLFDVSSEIEDEIKEDVKEIKQSAKNKTVKIAKKENKKKTSCVSQRRNAIITPEFRKKIDRIKKEKASKNK